MRTTRPSAEARDTIAALATARAAAGVGIIRLSGPEAGTIATHMCGQLPAARTAGLRNVVDGQGAVLDQAVIVHMPAPGSYTGDEVVEIHAHGSVVLCDLILARACELGARIARPGEFTERAFLSGKLDLAQAEAVADLIAAGSEAAVRAAQRSLRGEFSSRCEAIAEQLLELRLRVEAAIDFSDEDIDFLADADLARAVDACGDALSDFIRRSERGVRLTDGLTVVLVGAPNVGKSSLLNRLSGRDTAIVSDQPGTTRDVLRAEVVLEGVPVSLVDTAGLHDSSDPVENEGMRRARDEIAAADHVLLLTEDGAAPPVVETPARTTRVRSKCDLAGEAGGWDGEGDDAVLRISARSGAGVDALIRHLVGDGGQTEGELSARRRHLDALRRARTHLDDARAQLAAAQGELAAEELRLAHLAIGEITGAVSADDLLGAIFGRFCIGK